VWAKSSLPAHAELDTFACSWSSPAQRQGSQAGVCGMGSHRLAFNELEAFGLDEFIRRRRAPDALWGFVHIPKTAGTSLMASLDQKFGPLWRYEPPPALDGDRKTRRARWDIIRGFVTLQKESGGARFRSFAGHLDNPQMEYLTGEFPQARLFTIVRDPVERLISNYRYRLSLDAYFHEAFARENPTIEVFAARPSSQNLMMKFLFENGLALGGRDAHQLYSRFEFIGSLAHFEYSLHILARLLGVDNLSPRRLNVTKSLENNVVEIDDELREYIRKLNSADVALYDRVNQILENSFGANDGNEPLLDPPGRIASVTSGPAPGAASPAPIFILGPSQAGTASLLGVCRDVFGYEEACSAEDIREHSGSRRSFVAVLRGPDVSAVNCGKSGPQAKFVFVKERGIESVLAQLRRSSGMSFETACLEWAEQMRAWLALKGDLEQSYIEIDARELEFYPRKSARLIQEFLNIGSVREIEHFLRAQFAQTASIAGGYTALRDTDWDAAQRRRFNEICGELMVTFGYPREGLGGEAGQFDLAAAPLCGLWRIENGNRWILTDGPGMRLHPNRPDPGAPPVTVRFQGALEPGRYRFDGRLVVVDARCCRHRLVMFVSGGGRRECGRLEIDGAQVGSVPWEIASIEVSERSDVVIEIVLDESSLTHLSSATNLLSARFTRL